MTTSTLTLLNQFEDGKIFETNEEMLYVLQLQGSWFEMGRQYGALAKDHLEAMYQKSFNQKSIMA
ncbi:hypothetical protein JCM19239_3418 [Vibrio variabilis]|uniref:Uncharacterized protein n=1 Tax=Vibrio variabilis TaxID=990271 RepID=A0ABQ0JGR9_9VIBR|nr:hypothetical protein JCM19239_3418 [Vibrio variabilis]